MFAPLRGGVQNEVKNMVILGFLGILAGVALLIYLTCFRHWNVLIVSLFSVVLIILCNRLAFWNTIASTYAKGVGDWTQDFLILFTLGALLGRILQNSGMAQAIGESLTGFLGVRFVGLTIHILSFLLVFAGVDFMVAILSLAPISIAMVRKADLPRRFAIACMLGGGCSYVFAIPGTSSVNNLIPSDFFGTTTLAGWLPGLPGCIVTVILILLYQVGLKKKFRKKHMGFELSDEAVERDFGCREQSQLPPAWIGYAALLIVVASSVLLGGTGLLPAKLAICGGLTAAILLTLLAGRRYLRDPVLKVVEAGVGDGITGTISMGAMLGFVAVVQATPAFTSFVGWAGSISLPPLVSLIFTILLMNLVIANSPGSLNLYLNSFSANLLALGIQSAVIHRVAAMTSVSFAGMMPHNPGSIVTMRAYQTTYGESAADILIICALAPLVGTITTVALISAGLV